MIRMGQITFRFRMMCTSIDRVDPGALGRERSNDSVLYGFKFSPAVIASADTRLIGDHYDRNMPLVSLGDYFRSSRNDNDVISRRRYPVSSTTAPSRSK